MGMKKIFSVLFLISIAVSVFLIHFLIKSLNEFEAPEKFITNILEDLLTAKIQPRNGQNIFFIDTVRMKIHKKERPFTFRQACAIESAG